jgi:hypothetical protein
MATPGILSMKNFKTTDDMIGKVTTALSDPNNRAMPVSLDDLIASQQASNPLKTMTRHYPITCQGPVSSFMGGMKWKPSKEMLKAMFRSAKTDPGYIEAKKAGLSSVEARTGDGSNAIIVAMREICAQNNYPFSLAVVVNAVKGNHYADLGNGKLLRCVSVIPPSTNVAYPNRSVHEMPATKELYDAFYYKDITEDLLRKDIIPIPHKPEYCILHSCANSRIARELADPANADELAALDFNAADTGVTEEAGLHLLGGALVAQTKHAEWAISKILGDKEKHEDIVTTTNLSELEISFHPVGVESWEKIAEHPVFKYRSPGECNTLMNNPDFSVTWVPQMEHTFKDAYLLDKLTNGGM